MKTKPRFFGKKWTLEHDGESSFVTDAVSASTVRATRSRQNPTAIWVDCLKLWILVPPYIRRIVVRHLLK